MPDAAALEAGASPDAAEQTVTMSDFGEGSAIVRSVVESGRPTIVMQDGECVAAILDAATYQEVREEVLGRALLADLRESIRQADAGELVTHDEVMDMVRGQLRGRVSPAMQHRLDRL